MIYFVGLYIKSKRYIAYSTAMLPVELSTLTNDVSYHTFSLSFQSCELLFDISHYLTLTLQVRRVRIVVSKC